MKSAELFETLLPEFFDKDAIRVPPEITYRIDNQGERLYARKVGEEIKMVPSVTTILRNLPMANHLLQWYCNEFPNYDAAREFVERRADYGTFMHMLFKDILLGTTLTFNGTWLAESFVAYLTSIGKRPEGFDLKEVGFHLQQDLYAFVLWCKTYKVKPLAIEYIVFGEQYAGALDLVCRMTITKTRAVENYQSERMFAFIPEAGEVTEETEIIAEVDFKSGRKGFHHDNILQLHGLRKQWNIEHPDLAIEKIANYNCRNYRLPIGKTPPYDFNFHKDEEKHSKQWDLLVAMYQLEEIKIKDRSAFVEIGEISLTTELKQLVEKNDVLKSLKAKMEEQDGRENTTREPGAEIAGDRESKDRPKGRNGKRGKADESGLFQS